jgi:hypothetical protein
LVVGNGISCFFAAFFQNQPCDSYEIVVADADSSYAPVVV